MPKNVQLVQQLEGLVAAQRAVFSLGGLWCSSCAKVIEARLLKVAGITGVQVNFASATALISWRAGVINFAELIQAVEKLGYKLQLWSATAKNSATKQQQKKLSLQLALAIFFGMWSMLGSWVLYVADNPPTVEFNLALATYLLAVPVIFYSGQDFYRAALNSLRLRISSLDALVSLGVWGSWLISSWNLYLGKAEVYVDAATMLITFLLISRLIEIKIQDTSRSALAALNKLSPEQALKLDAHNNTTLVAVASLQVNDRVLVELGARCPVDGLVTQGSSWLDSSLLTGETQPAAIHTGDLIYAGVINLTAPLAVQVIAVIPQRRIDILGLKMLEIFSGRSSLAASADKIIQWLMPSILLAALLAFIFYLFQGQSVTLALLGGLSLLVAACPCALSLALPLAFSLASQQAAKNGVVWRDPASVENLAQARIFTFDKTGTLTQGQLEVSAYEFSHKFTWPEILEFIHLAEVGNSHPLAKALFAFVQRQTAWQSVFVQQPNAWPQAQQQSLGVTAKCAQGEIMLGAYAWLAEKQVQDLPAFSPSCVYLALNKRWIASFHLHDSPRPEAQQALASLAALPARLGIITGDSPSATKHLINKLGINFAFVLSQASPEAKAEYVLKLKEKVVFVGDGANDGLVLASAAAGVAMPSANRLARAAAGVLITEGGLDKLVTTTKLARKFYQIGRQNLFFALVYNLGIVGIFFVVGVTPFAAALAMLASSLSLSLNSLRLAR